MSNWVEPPAQGFDFTYATSAAKKANSGAADELAMVSKKAIALMRAENALLVRALAEAQGTAPPASEPGPDDDDGYSDDGEADLPPVVLEGTKAAEIRRLLNRLDRLTKSGHKGGKAKAKGKSHVQRLAGGGGADSSSDDETDSSFNKVCTRACAECG